MNRYNLTWSDAGKALMVMFIANLCGLIMGLPDAQLPTWVMVKENLVLSLKFSLIPYLIKNFLSDDIKAAQTTLEKAAKKNGVDESGKTISTVLLVALTCLSLTGCKPELQGGGWLIPLLLTGATIAFIYVWVKEKDEAYKLPAFVSGLALIAYLIWLAAQ